MTEREPHRWASENCTAPASIVRLPRSCSKGVWSPRTSRASAAGAATGRSIQRTGTAGGAGRDRGRGSLGTIVRSRWRSSPSRCSGRSRCPWCGGRLISGAAPSGWRRSCSWRSPATSAGASPLPSASSATCSPGCEPLALELAASGRRVPSMGARRHSECVPNPAHQRPASYHRRRTGSVKRHTSRSQARGRTGIIRYKPSRGRILSIRVFVCFSSRSVSLLFLVPFAVAPGGYQRTIRFAHGPGEASPLRGRLSAAPGRHLEPRWIVRSSLAPWRAARLESGTLVRGQGPEGCRLRGEGPLPADRVNAASFSTGGARRRPMPRSDLPSDGTSRRRETGRSL